MPRKVSFRVVAVSGEDENHRAKELNVHGPTVQGWQSPRFCTYPQEIVVHLEGRTRICKIQILSHQYLIATQIKISVGDAIDGNTSLQTVKYKNLGYISLSDNERTNFKARELKSVHVDVVGTFVKFIIHKNHANVHNACNQVGIIAINIIGDEVSKNDSLTQNKDLSKTEFTLSSVPGMVRRRPDQISPLDDLTFDMYQDPEVAQVIRKLEAKKQEAVCQERYEFAKKLKVAITDLYKVGETLGKYEIEKRQAIAMEDYDKARRKKAQMEDFRIKMYEQLELPKLMEVAEKYSEAQNELPPKEGSVQNRIIVPELHTVDNNLNERDDILEAIQTNENNNESNDVGDGLMHDERIKTISNDQTVKPISSYIAYEERALPGSRGKQSRSSVDHSDIELSRGSLPNHMSEQDKRQASLPIEVFGLPVVQLAYSKMFCDREDSLDEVREQVLSYGASDIQPGKVMRAAAYLAQKGLRDIVLSVFSKALDLLTVLLLKFPVKQKVPKSEISHTVDKVLPEIIAKLGDKAQRQRTAAHQYILEMMDYPEVSNLPTVPLQCCQPLSTQVQPRLAQGQAELVEQLVNKLGVDKNNGLTLSTVMPFAVSALQHPCGPVREAGERIITTLYRDKGREVRRYLPPSSSTMRKNMIFRQLYETFDRIDAENQRRHFSIVSTLSSSENGKFSQRRSSLAALPTPELVDRLEKTCIFCNEKDESFTSERLDLHYWKHCPMLMKCSHCKQVVEIAALTEHLLEECVAKDKFSKCRRCQEAIPKRDYDIHIKLRTCIPAKLEKAANRCPLCHKNISSGDTSWRTHLMGKNGCEENPRRKRIHKVPNDQMKKSQSADRALAIGKPDKTPVTRMSRSTTRTFNATTRWR